MLALLLHTVDVFSVTTHSTVCDKRIQSCCSPLNISRIENYSENLPHKRQRRNVHSKLGAR
jgi:hypothetical protein